ncbi:hypothetical protein AAE478_007065 [Parahypoxylon ruwenzoriense]
MYPTTSQQPQGQAPMRAEPAPASSSFNEGYPARPSTAVASPAATRQQKSENVAVYGSDNIILLPIRTRGAPGQAGSSPSANTERSEIRLSNLRVEVHQDADDQPGPGPGENQRQGQRRGQSGLFEPLEEEDVIERGGDSGSCCNPIGCCMHWFHKLHLFD